MSCAHLDFTIVDVVDGVDIKKCSACQLVYRSTTAQDFAPEIIYADYYKNKKGAVRFDILTEFIVRLWRKYRANYLIKKHSALRSVLDIGCGRGWTLWYLRQLGATRVLGTQISAPAAAFASDVLKLPIIEQDLLVANINESFDMVTMWHVLEHVPKPAQYLKRINELLNVDGVLVIEVPNWNSWTRKLAGQYWLGYDVAHHISFFAHDSLVPMLEQAGFDVKKMASFSGEYSLFLSLSTLTSKILKRHHALFNALQGRGWRWSTLIEMCLMVIMAMPVLIINLILIHTTHGEVLRIVAIKQ